MRKRPDTTPTGWVPNDGHPTTEYTHPHHPGVRITLIVCDGRWILSHPATAARTPPPRAASARTVPATTRHWTPVDAAFHFQLVLKNTNSNPPQPARLLVSNRKKTTT